MANLFDVFEVDEEAKEESTKKQDSKDPSKDLVEDLIEWLERDKTEKARAPGLHCSSLWKTCARTPLLMAMFGDLIEEEKLKAGSHMTFDMGHALHDMIQNHYLGPFGRLWGNWKCLNCQAIVHVGTLPKSCGRCDVPWRNPKDGTINIVYDESFVKDKELDYCGHCDGIILGRDGKKKRVFEFKTKSKSQFGRLRRPEFSHIIQVHAYMNGLGLREAIVLYWDKGSQCDWSRDGEGNWLAGDVHLKAYHIPFDDELWAEMKTRIMDYHKATALVKTLPTVTSQDVMKFKRVCAHDKCDLAISCKVSKFCFRMPK